MANLLELVTRLRQRLDDFGGDSELWKTDDAGCLWSNLELSTYLSEAETEWVRRRQGLRDRTTAAVCEIALVIDQADYALDPRVLSVDSVWLNDDSLTKIFQNDVEGGLTASPTTVTYYQEDAEEGLLRLYATPDATGTLKLAVRRLPLTPMSWVDAAGAALVTPEINARAHFDLIDWAAHLAYLKQDADTEDMQKAGYHQGRFSQRAGDVRSAKEERMLKDTANARLRVRSTFW